jgi:membrane dipeptidase
VSALSALSETDQARAARLHADSLVVDTLSPFGPLDYTVYTPAILEPIAELIEQRAPVMTVLTAMHELVHRERVRGELPGFWNTWDEAGVDVISVTMGVFWPRQFSFESAVNDLARVNYEFEVLSDRMMKVSSAADARRAKAEGKRGVILNFQNSDHLEGDLANLELFYKLGIRILQLSYQKRNLAGDGCTERVQSGLSHWGVQLVREMNELGILVDVSHCGEATALDAIEVSERPVAVTHAVAKEVTSHPRGKSDDVIRAIAEAEGYFGVCLVPFFISDSDQPTIDDWLRHLDHVVELAGIEHVGIASDYGVEYPPGVIDRMNEMILGLGFQAEHHIDWNMTIDGFRYWREWPNITRVLVARGYSDEDIIGLLGGNFLRVFDAAIGE